MKELIEALKSSVKTMDERKIKLAKANAKHWEAKEALMKALTQKETDSLKEDEQHGGFLIGGFLKDGEHVYEVDGELLSISYCHEDYKVIDVNLVVPLKIETNETS